MPSAIQVGPISRNISAATSARAKEQPNKVVKVRNLFSTMNVPTPDLMTVDATAMKTEPIGDIANAADPVKLSLQA